MRLHADQMFAGRRKYKIDRFPPNFIEHKPRVTETHTKQTDHACHRALVQFIAVPQRIADLGGVGVESDILAQGRVAELR